MCWNVPSRWVLPFKGRDRDPRTGFKRLSHNPNDMTPDVACANLVMRHNAAMNEHALAASKPMTFIVTGDRERAKAFYRDILGFRLVSEDAFAAVFDMNGTMLRMSTVPGHRGAAYTVLGWEVRDITATVRALRDRGVEFNFYDGFQQDDDGVWHAPGSSNKVAWFLDPDGNNLSLTQFQE
jgi:catechol 2,3-dioxygenase-like lactoylglutathione lyase family enzyme